MKFKKIVLFYISNLFTFLLVAQFPNPINFNTATNATNTGTLAIGSNDLHWTAALTNSLGPYVPAVSCGNQAPCCWTNSPYLNANWISYPHTCVAGSPAEHSCLNPASVDVFYKLAVNLPSVSCNQAIITPSAYCLSFDFFSDNCVYQIFVNGVSNYLNPSGNPYYAMDYAPGGNKTISLCNNWQSGANTVIVHVKSGTNPSPTWEAFLAQANQTVNTTVGVPLNASISQTNVSCFGNNNGSASVSVSGGGGSYTYTWLPTGGNTNVASNLSAGNYTLIASSASGCVNTQTLAITQPPASTISVSNNTVVCTGSSVNISASGANTYLWSNGATGSVIAVNTAGTYTVTGTNTVTGCSNVGTISVGVAASPTVTITGNTSICTGNTAALTANGANNYVWSTGATNSVITVNSIGTYSVTGTNTLSGCTKTNTINVTIASNPTLSISGISTICSGAATTLTVTGASTYTWSNASNSSTISTNLAGVYTVTGTSNPLGCKNTATVNVTSSNNPTITITGTNSLCAGSSVSLAATGANSYSWNTGSNTSVINALPVTTMAYLVTGSDVTGNCHSQQTYTVNVIPLPTIQITGNTQLCSGSSGTLLAAGATIYLWNTGSTTNSLLINPTSLTIYNVSGTNTATGCKNNASITVTVGAYPIITVSNATICAGQVANVIASGATTYTWSEGSQGNVLNVTPTSNTNYTVTGSGIVPFCTSSASLMIVVAPIPTLNVTTDKITICVGENVNLYASGTDTYNWNNGVQTNINNVMPIITTTYIVIGGNNNLLCKTTKTIQITVNRLPNVKIIADTTVCLGDELILKGLGANSYLWNNGINYSIISTSLKENEIFSVTGTDSITGCANTYTILPLPSNLCCQLYIPNTFTPNDDNKNDTFYALSICKFKNYKLCIYDRWGEKIFTANDISQHWNGFYKGQLCKEDVYVYTLEYTTINPSGIVGSKYFYKTGHVNLVGSK